MSSIVQTKNLSRWYGQVTGVIDLTLEIGGGVTGLLGPNGAGKSTFLSMVTGQIQPTRGSLTVLGEDPWNNPKLMGRIGYSSEVDAFYEEMTGFDFLCILLRYSGLSRKVGRQSADAALELVGLSHARDRKIGGYSKGMRQRIKVAQALAHEPELVILDEPLNGMDPVARAETTRLVKYLGDVKRHVIVSSHVLYEVEAMTSQILLIHQGKVLAEGNIHDIRDLIDEHPHQVKIECARPRELAARLLAFEDIVSVSIDSPPEGDGNGKAPEEESLPLLTVTSRKPDEFYERVGKLVLETGIEVSRLSSADDNLQAVFKYLVR